jgi:AraC-like DNA-binding protein
MNILGRGQFFVVSSYLQQLQSYLKQLNLPPVELLRNSDLPLFTMSQPSLYLGHESIADINAYLCTIVPSETHLIKYLATERDALTHGSMGVAALLSSDLENAILVIQKYIKTRYSGMEAEIVLIEDALRIMLSVPETNDQSDRLTVLSTFLMFESTLRNMLVMEPDSYPIIISVIYPKPADWVKLSTNTDVRFNQSHNIFEFPQKLLKKQLLFSDQRELFQATRVCDHELNNIESFNDLSEVIKSKLIQSRLPLPNIEVVASELNLSIRTLRRRLEALGIQYIDLKQSVLNTRALELLLSNKRSLQQISWELGYSDYKSFSRAFKKLNALTPSQYRKTIK